MMQRDPPRHIRDIAHLYLSRGRPPRTGTIRLVVAGVSPDVIPGFHVANLALSAAARGMTVRILEASGLPVSAGCFLGLDPGCWVANGHPSDATVSAFARVWFTHSAGRGAQAWAASSGNDAGDGVEMVHAPPWDAGDEHVRTIHAAPALPTVLLYLAGRDEPPQPWLEARPAAHVVATRVVFVEVSGAATDGAGCAGVITRWRGALTDPLPAVMRDPGSRLARQYDGLLSCLVTHAEHHHATAPLEPL